jgi:uncharacterized protein
MKSLSMVVAVIALTAQPIWCFGASFDCRKATTNIEKTICASADLRSRDLRLYENYHRVTRLSPNPDQLRLEQRRWIKESRDRCETSQCLVEVYEKRIDQLQTMIAREDCSGQAVDSLSIGFCERRHMSEAEKSIGDLSVLLSARFDRAAMERFKQRQSEWRLNIECGCSNEVGWGSGPSHSAEILSCEKVLVQQRLSEIREILIGNQGLEYGGNVPTSCAAIQQMREKDPGHQIFRAIENNDLETVKKIFKKSAEIPEWPDGPDSPLSLAAQKNNVEIVAYLLSQGVSPKYDDKAMSSALFHCNKRIVSLLIEHGAPVKTGNWVTEPLSHAAAGGCKEGVKLLVEKWADAKASNALPRATGRCDLEITQYLIAAGADVNAEDRGPTPLLNATQTAVADRQYRDACKDVIVVLLKAGARPEYTNVQGKSALDAAANDQEIRAILERKDGAN